jgi:hypothetical protein
MILMTDQIFAHKHEPRIQAAFSNTVSRCFAAVAKSSKKTSCIALGNLEILPEKVLAKSSRFEVFNFNTQVPTNGALSESKP